MYQQYVVSPSMLFLVSMFSLAWLVVGILLGQRIPKPKRKRSGGRGGRKTQQKRSKDDGSIEIYVGNLSYETGEKELRKTFSQYGKVTGVRVIMNRFNGKSKGFGFVDMPDSSEADAAVSAMDNSELDGRRIVVNEAKSSAR